MNEPMLANDLTTAMFNYIDSAVSRKEFEKDFLELLNISRAYRKISELARFSADFTFRTNQKERTYVNLLEHGIRKDCSEVVINALIDYIQEVYSPENLLSIYGNALKVAANSKKLSFVQRLIPLAAKADFNKDVTVNECYSPLAIATKGKWLPGVIQLLIYGFDPDAIDIHAKLSPFQIATNTQANDILNAIKSFKSLKLTKEAYDQGAMVKIQRDFADACDHSTEMVLAFLQHHTEVMHKELQNNPCSKEHYFILRCIQLFNQLYNIPQISGPDATLLVKFQEMVVSSLLAHPVGADKVFKTTEERDHFLTQSIGSSLLTNAPFVANFQKMPQKSSLAQHLAKSMVTFRTQPQADASQSPGSDNEIKQDKQESRERSLSL